MTSKREIRRAIERVASEAGAGVTFARTGNLSHFKVHLTYGGRSRFVTISGTPGKTYAIDAMIAEVRRTLRELGYVEPAKPKKAHKPFRPHVVSGGKPERAPDYLPPPRRRPRPKYGSEINGMTVQLRTLLPGYPWRRAS